MAVSVVQAQVEDADAVHVGHAELGGAQVAGVPRVRHKALQAGQLGRWQACLACNNPVCRLRMASL